ncbi:MAG TPA: SUMF1/EgtB/PvdO family nonheme iron enzyme, partial [Vicinamibacteria bacterium]|nr:SUMF1/EgtB/PvdO family nonheme iron enzyme [Vicinamibacteria bacterium]
MAHDTRWDLPLPSRAATLEYMAAVLEQVLAALAQAVPRLRYLATYAVFHEDMHGEAFAYTRQTLGYPAPAITGARARGVGGAPPPAEPWPNHDCPVPAQTLLLGAAPGDSFVFDNEKWAHPVELSAFRIARDAVTQGEFAEFVGDGGYARPELWTRPGREWLTRCGANHPLYWRPAPGAGGEWERRHFDRWVRLEPALPMVHVNAFEAEAWCRWRGRRLPTEAEWEAAAGRRRFPWGDEAPDATCANLDGLRLGCVDASALPFGDSAAGCRQMMGNVWEWTSTPFAPYPGFTPDMYADYSQPWFHSHRVLRGGCWATRGRLLRNTWRNFYTPDRRDVW